MSKKEEKSEAYIKPTILYRNKNLNDNNWKRGLDYMDFTGNEVQIAFEDGWDAAVDKACEWLKENSGYYVEHWDGDTWINSKLYEDFRRAMEE